MHMHMQVLCQVLSLSLMHIPLAGASLLRIRSLNIVKGPFICDVKKSMLDKVLVEVSHSPNASYSPKKRLPGEPEREGELSVLPHDVDLWGSLANIAHAVGKARPMSATERNALLVSLEPTLTPELQALLQLLSARWSLIAQCPQDTSAFYVRSARSPSKKLLGVDRQRELNSLPNKLPLSWHAIECASDVRKYEQSSWNGLVPMATLRRWLETFENNKPRCVRFQSAAAMKVLLAHSLAHSLSLSFITHILTHILSHILTYSGLENQV